MAIQFKCPACDAIIRVPDTSAGKKGTCPQCREKLIVPTVAQGDTATIAGLSAVSTSKVGSGNVEAPHLGMPHIDLSGKQPRSQTDHSASTTPKRDVAGTDSQSESNFPAIDISGKSVNSGSDPGIHPLIDDMSPGLAQKLAKKERQKRQSRKMAWVTPAVCGVVLIGVLAALYWNSQPKLQGQLKGHLVANLEVRPALIPGNLSGLSKAELDDILRHLKSTPAVWTSHASKIKLEGTADGVAASFQPGRDSQLVMIQSAQNKAIVDFIKQHGDAMEKPRLAAIQKHAPKLFEGLLMHFTEKTPIIDQAELRDEVIYPSLVTGVGFHLEVAVKGTKYPCVYEDGEGGIYFLIPDGTKSFTLQGRKIAGGVTFPANFTVQVEGQDNTSRTVKKKAKTKEDRESDNQGMNPELYQDNRKDTSAPTSQADALKGGLGNLLAPGSRASNTKTKSPRQMKMDKMDDEEMPDDAMPAKPKPKK